MRDKTSLKVKKGNKGSQMTENKEQRCMQGML